MAAVKSVPDGLLLPKTHSNIGNANPCLRKLSELEEVTDAGAVVLSPEEEDALIIETTYGALISHIWWTLWSLIQSEISSIDFGFMVSRGPFPIVITGVVRSGR